MKNSSLLTTTGHKFKYKMTAEDSADDKIGFILLHEDFVSFKSHVVN